MYSYGVLGPWGLRDGDRLLQNIAKFQTYPSQVLEEIEPYIIIVHVETLRAFDYSNACQVYRVTGRALVKVYIGLHWESKVLASRNYCIDFSFWHCHALCICCPVGGVQDDNGGFQITPYFMKYLDPPLVNVRL